MKSKERFKLLKAGIDITIQEEAKLTESYRTTMLVRCKRELPILLDQLQGLKAASYIKALEKDNTITRTINLINLQEKRIDELLELLKARDMQIKSLNTPIEGNDPEIDDVFNDAIVEESL